MAKTSTPIPTGFSTVTPHLVLSDVSKAIEFYKKAFGAVELLRLPMPNGKIMHASVQIGNSRIMMCDEFDQCNSKSPSTLGTAHATMHIFVEDVDAAFKRAVEAGGTATMEPQDMFWGDRYGVVVDPFGQPWSIATHVEDLTPEQIMQRCAEGSCNSKEPATASAKKSK